MDWEKRFKEKPAAAAFLATSDGKQRRAESDISEAAKRLDEANRNLVSAEKQKLAKSPQQLVTVEARGTERESRHGKAASEFAQLTDLVQQTRTQAEDWKTKRDPYQQPAA